MMEKNLRNAGFSDEQINEIESNKEKAGQVKKEYENRMAEQKKDLVEKISIIQTNMNAADEQAKNK